MKKREGRVGGKRARQESEGEVGKKVRKESVSEKVRKESETTLKTVQDKVNRSMGLLQSLGIEKDRWGLTSNKLKLQMTTLISDIFLSSAFLSYGGYFNQQHRNSLLLTTWAHHLETAAIAFRTDPNEWLNWQTKSLPSDDLCTENAIDLSGQATELIFDYRDQTSATEFILFEYTYNSELLLIRAGIEVNPGPTFEMKKIQDAAEKIWKHAGQVVDIPAEQHYTYEGITELDPSVTTQLVNILKEDLGVSFQLKHYQNVTIQAMAKLKDVIVISPPGSGKSLATYAGASLLRKLHNKPAGVVLHLVPYNSIIVDKVKNPWLPTGYIMMGGKTGTEEAVDEEGDVRSNFTIQDLEEGKLSVLVCHPESLLSKQGEEILKCLLRSNLLLAVMVDEFHKVLFWGCSEAELTGRQKDEFSVAFRPGMKKVVRKLKSLASKVPFVFETATIMPSEIELAKKTFSIKSPVIIRSSPIQQQHCYFNLRRPDQGVPWEGDEDEAGNHIPGLKDVLMELVVKPYINIVKSETSGSQKIMLFSKNRATLDMIDQELCVLLPDQSRLLPDQSPW